VCVEYWALAFLFRLMHQSNRQGDEIELAGADSLWPGDHHRFLRSAVPLVADKKRRVGIPINRCRCPGVKERPPTFSRFVLIIDALFKSISHFFRVQILVQSVQTGYRVQMIRHVLLASCIDPAVDGFVPLVIMVSDDATCSIQLEQRPGRCPIDDNRRWEVSLIHRLHR